MGRFPSNHQNNNNNELKKGPWTPEEDEKLINYIQKSGLAGSWQLLPKKAGLNRCGKSCRLRWTNYLRPDIRRGNFSPEEEQTIIDLHSILGNKWSTIAIHLPGRTDNEIKNFWNTHLRKKLLQSGIDPQTHQPIITTNDHINPLNLLLMNILPADPLLLNNNNLINMYPSPFENLAKIQLLRDILLLLKTNININPPIPNFMDIVPSQNINLNKFDGINITPEILNTPNLEYSYNTIINSSDFKPVSDTFTSTILFPESTSYTKNKAIISNNNTTSEFSLPALLSHDEYSGNVPNYDQMVMDFDTFKDGEEASSSSFWKNICIE